jgi:hypothetical protein
MLGQWYRRNEKSLWVCYTEGLIGSLLGDERVTLDRETLAGKLAAEYISTLAEIEVAIFLLGKGCSVILEPTAPLRGPDMRADHAEQSYYVEVRAVGDSEDDERFNAASSEIFSLLNQKPSRFTVSVTIGENYSAGSGDFRKATEALVNALDLLNSHKWKRGILYHSSQGTLLNPGRSLNAKEQELVDNADLVASFNDSGTDQPRTPATASRPFKRLPDLDQTHERLKKILNKKRTQLPQAARGIIVFDVSDLFMLSDFSIDSALYGDLVVRLTAPSAPGGPIGGPTVFRNGRGFFGRSSRVSAVVFHTRRVREGKLESSWRVYPTNRANADTIRLHLAELNLFGDVEDRQTLSAESFIQESMRTS